MRQSMDLMSTDNRRLPSLRFSASKTMRESEKKTLLDLVVAEFSTAALFSIVATCIVAARLDGRAVRLAGPAEIYLPSAPTVLPNAITALSKMGMATSILQSILAFHTRATFAARLSTPVFSRWNENAESGTGDLAGEHAVWNTVCGAALLVVHFLYAENGFPDDTQERSMQLIRDSIRAIGNGQTPFVRSDSTVFIPGWFDYRREVRRTFGWRVEVHHQNHRMLGVLENLSRTGMGLSTQSVMIVGRPVCAILQDGRQLEGTIVWVNGLRCGATLLRTLDSHDPLIR